MILTILAVIAGLSTAKPGATIVLTGPQGFVDIFDRSFSPALTIDAREATFDRLRIRRSSGLTIIGGRYGAAPDMAVEVAASSAITLREGVYTASGRGIAIGGSTNIRVERPILTGLRADGITLVSSHDVTISDGVCADFSPKPGDHPDCIQGWSITGQKPSSDITISGMRVVGKMQGIFFGNPLQGGSDRVTVRGNDVTSAYVNGIGLFECRACVVEDNRISSTAGSANKSMLRVKGGSVSYARNRVE